MAYNIEKEVKKTISKYKLISNKKEKIAVALSGGKDSASVLSILNKLGYKTHALMIDLDLGSWSKTHKENMIEFCSELNIPLTIVDLKKEIGHGICFIKSIMKKEKNLSGCTVCGIIKKYILNKWAKKLKADKIATGHNLDDETQTVIMNFLKGNIFLGINSSPATGINSGFANNNNNNNNNNKSTGVSSKFIKNCVALQEEEQGRKEVQCIKNCRVINNKTPEGFIQRIKPLFFIPESEVKKYALKMKFPILYDKCPCAIGTYRIETRSWLSDIKDKDKLKIVKEFQKLIPELKEKQTAEIIACKICGEPSRSGTCNACKIFSYVKYNIY